MTHEAAKTGLGPTVLVAVEQYFPQPERIVDDPFAYAILPFSMRIFVKLTRLRAMRDWMVRATETSAPGIYGGLLCRKRYIDEQITASAGQVHAILNLGAGFDTRAFRLPALSGMPVLEADQPENVARKRACLERIYSRTPKRIQLIPIDFDHEDLRSRLNAENCSLDAPVFVVWEAVTQYLSEAGIEKHLIFWPSFRAAAVWPLPMCAKTFSRERLCMARKRSIPNMSQTKYGCLA